MRGVAARADVEHLLLSLLQGFYWLDEGLQNYLRSRGWPAVTRPQSMVMANIVLGVRRPSEIARRLGVSRQAIHATLGQMIELGMISLVEDPSNGRAKMVTLTTLGEKMRVDARAAMHVMTSELGRRVDEDALMKAAHLLNTDWGAAMTFPAEPGRQADRRPHPPAEDRPRLPPPPSGGTGPSRPSTRRRLPAPPGCPRNSARP